MKKPTFTSAAQSICNVLRNALPFRSQVICSMLVAGVLFSTACSSKKVIGPESKTGPLGSENNPIDLIHDPSAREINANDLVKYIYVHAPREHPITIQDLKD